MGALALLAQLSVMTFVMQPSERRMRGTTPSATAESSQKAPLTTRQLFGGSVEPAPQPAKPKKTKASHIASILYYWRFIGIACGPVLLLRGKWRTVTRS